MQNRRAYREDLAELVRLLEAGEISPHIGARLPFEEVVRAHEMLEGAKVTGKIVLEMG